MLVYVVRVNINNPKDNLKSIRFKIYTNAPETALKQAKGHLQDLGLNLLRCNMSVVKG